MKTRLTRVLMTAVALALFAGTAQAATVVEKDGFNWSVKGDWQIQLRQDPNVDVDWSTGTATLADQELDVEYDDLELKNSVTYKINDTLTAFGQLDFGFKKAAEDDNDNPHLEEAYLGLDFGTFSVLAGKTDSAADEFGVEAAYEEYFGEDAFDVAGALDGDDLIAFKTKIGENVAVHVAHELAAESEDSGAEEFTDICIAAEFGDFEAAVAYQVYNDDANNPLEEDVETFGVSLAYDAKVVKVAADYSVAEKDNTPAEDLTFINAVITVPVDEKTKANIGMAMVELDNVNNADATAWYANITHKLDKKVSVFAEITDSDVDSSDMGYLAGMRIKF